MVDVGVGEQDLRAVEGEGAGHVDDLRRVAARIDHVELPLLLQMDEITVGFEESDRKSSDVHNDFSVAAERFTRMTRPAESLLSSRWSSTSLP